MTNLERYTRNVIIDKIGEEGQKKLLSSKILVAGAGGLGSTVITNLSSIGIGTIGIVDNDVIELSNLNRQYIHKFENIGISKVISAKNWVNGFNPDINVETYAIRLNDNNYKDIVCNYDIIIDCFDSYKSKFLLNRIAINSNKILIHGGVTEFAGQVTTIIPGKTACLNCLLQEDTETIFDIKGVISPAVSTIASIQSFEAVKIILGIGKTLTNQLLTYDGLNMEFKKLHITPNSHCSICTNNLR